MRHSPEIEDELMLEMRALKEEFAARFDFDIKKMGKHLREWEEKNRDKVTVRPGLKY